MITDATLAAVLGITLVSSFMICASLILTQRWHGWLSLDHDTTGAQKIHQHPVPRVGGVAIALSLLLGALLMDGFAEQARPTAFVLLLCALPVFAAGLIEDLTKRVSVRTRMLASITSALLAIWLLDTRLLKLDTPGLDSLMVFAPFAVAFTCFAVSGVTNAVNIIDGLNGLASGSVAIMLAGLGAIAWMQEDFLVLQLCLGGVAALLGFMVLNYPFGKIFLGDGGAYLVGFWQAECAVLLLARNPEVSTWAVLLICFYPVWETAFSMYRRHIVHKVSSGTPDMQHLHHRVLRLLVDSKLGEHMPPWVHHGLATPVCWLLILGCQGLALSDYRSTPLLVVGVIVFVVVYQLLYKAGRHRETAPSLR